MEREGERRMDKGEVSLLPTAYQSAGNGKERTLLAAAV